MASVSDVVLIGTGVAPLAAATRLMAEGKKVLLLNPDWDFFRENSELPFDPFWPPGRASLSVERLSRGLRKRALSVLRPCFPGAVELWSGDAKGDFREGFHDPEAPHVRTRSRLWMHAPEVGGIGAGQADLPWEVLEEVFVEASDAGLNPNILEGVLALSAFPGASTKGQLGEGLHALSVPKMCDVDVSRYRNGLLEYVRERAGAQQVLCSVSQMDWMPEGLRYHAQGRPCSVRVTEGVLVFWTPRLSQWILAQAKKADARPNMPAGVRLWEEWSLLSRYALDLSVIGTFGDTSVWAEIEGAPESSAQSVNSLGVLRSGPLVAGTAETGAAWASTDSFRSLARLCHDLLKWDKFSVRSLRPRALLEWHGERPDGFWLTREPLPVRVVSEADGPLVDVVNAAFRSCDTLDCHDEEPVE